MFFEDAFGLGPASRKIGFARVSRETSHAVAASFRVTGAHTVALGDVTRAILGCRFAIVTRKSSEAIAAGVGALPVATADFIFGL